jgi:hypothetical protein
MPRSPQAKGKTAGATEQVVLVDNLTGGVELNTAQSNLAPDQARRLLNFSLEEPGLLVTLPGFDKFSTTSLGSERSQGGERVYTTSGAFTLVAFDGDIYKPSDAGVWGSAVLSGRDDSNEIYFPYDRIVAMVMDGVNVPDMTKDGTTWYDVGIAEPAAPTVVDVAGGGLIDTNVYEFAYSYATSSSFDSELVHEGNVGDTVEDTINAANLTARLTVTYSTDPKVDTIYIYMRNTTAGQTVLRRYTSIANNTAGGTTTVDVTADVEEAATNHDIPLAFSFAVPWKNRIWARHPSVKNRIHFTQVFENQTWPSNFFIDVPLEKGDDVESMVALGDILVVFGQSGIFLIVGQTSLDFEVRPALTAETGAFGFRAAKRVEAGVIHAGPPGVYIFDGASDSFLSLAIEKGWKDMVDSSSYENLTRVDIAYFQPLKQVSVAVPIVYPTGQPGEWILDLNRSRIQERETWTSSNRGVGGYISWNGHETSQGNVGRLFSWSFTTGELYEERTGTTADGATFTAEYEGPVFTTQLKNARAIQGFVEYEPADGTLTFELVVDGATQGVQSIDLGTGLAMYGSALYGTATYGGESRTTTALYFPLEADGKNFLVKITYAGTSRFRLLAYGFSLVSEPVIRGI